MHHMVCSESMVLGMLWVLSKKLLRRNGAFKLCEFLWLLFNATRLELRQIRLLLVFGSIKYDKFFSLS